MLKKTLVAVLALAAIASAAHAGSTFQQSCSQIEFVYSSNQPVLQAVCLKADGTTNSTSLVLQGISNQNGTLVQGTGASSFQKSCGNIQIQVTSPTSVNLTAYCRTSSGSSNATSLPLNNIGNNNGVLTGG
ncbi:MAG TPA: CVNH domain-containing protein [Thermoanaerobaculia bacterium]|nr:CVNH domain-containing protein [Thermoanaerobaculia bacterium]